MRMTRQAAAQPLTSWPDGWPPCDVRALDPSSREFRPVTADQHAHALAVLADTLGPADIHPWEAVAASQERFLPPLATAWMRLAPAHRVMIVQKTWRRAQNRAINAVRDHGADYHAAIDIDPSRVTDLPVDRLLALGRDRVMASLTTHLADGDDWAARALLRIAETG